MFAQTSLAPLRGLMTSRQGMSDAMLREVVALLAYENPMVRSSCYFASHPLACRSSLLKRTCVRPSVRCYMETWCCRPKGNPRSNLTPCLLKDCLLDYQSFLLLPARVEHLELLRWAPLCRSPHCRTICTCRSGRHQQMWSMRPS